MKTFNMSHILATRYKIDEDFGTQASLEEIDKIEGDIREKQHLIHKKEHDKDKKEAKEKIEEMRKELGSLKDTYKKTLREKKSKIGNELFNR